jgi:hypothetical protein
VFTFALVLALATPDQVGTDAKERGFEILAGIALLVVGLAIVRVLADRLAKRRPAARTGGVVIGVRSG